MNNKEGPSRQIWIEAAVEELSIGGINAVRIERLASRLGISKGPFYWRFADRSDLLSAVLSFWENELTETLIIETQAEPTPRERLQKLNELALVSRHGNIDVARAEGAFRAWAALDSQAAEAAKRIDKRRLDHLATEIAAMAAVPGDPAKRAAKGIYLALLGLYVARQYTPDLADDDAYRDVVKSILDSACSVKTDAWE